MFEIFAKRKGKPFVISPEFAKEILESRTRSDKQEEIRLKYNKRIEERGDDYKAQLSQECDNIMNNVTVVFNLAKLGYTKESLNFIKNLFLLMSFCL